MLLLSWMAHPASAADYGTVDGTGTYSPGIPVSGCDFQRMTFSGTMVLAGSHPGTYAVTFDGQTTGCATLLSEHGSGTLSGEATGSLVYVRIGNHVSYRGSLTLSGHATSVTAWECVRTYTSLNPAGSFADHCQVAFD